MFTRSCCNECSSNKVFEQLIFFTVSSTFSSQAFVGCIGGFGNNASQDLVSKRTMCSFLVKGKLNVGAGLPRHTSVFSFPTMILFLEVPKQNSSKQKSYRRPRILSENHGKRFFLFQSFREEEGEENIWLPLINNLRQATNICTNTHTISKLIFHRC